MYGNVLPAPAPAPADSDRSRCAEVQRVAPPAELDDAVVGALGAVVVTGVRPADAVAETVADADADAVDDVDDPAVGDAEDVHAASASTKSALAAAPSTRSMDAQRG